MPFQVGERVGDYEIVGVLGTGGMGQVYKVRNVISERLEAMKVLLPNLEGDPALADRFLREIKVLATLDHPNIASLRTAFRSGNQLVMVMELVEGVGLDERVRQGPIPVAEALDYFCQALSALDYAHSRGVIHRDIKPANLMVTPQGVVKLMDFGIAKPAGDRQLTRTGTTLGSLYYMSPEQVTGGPLDARSDIYSMGVALYEVLTGTRPFKGDSEFSIMAAHLEGQVVPPIQVNPLLGPVLNEIIMTAIAKDPAQRFQSAAAFRNALLQAKESLSAAAAPLSATGAVAAAPQPPAPAAQATWQAASPPPPPVTAPPSPPLEPAVAPFPPAQPTPVAAPARTHRGLYMALGVVIGLAVLALAATQLPRWLRTRAAPATNITPAQEVAPQPGAMPTAPEVTGAATTAGAESPQAPASGPATGASSIQAPATSTATGGVSPQPSVAAPAEQPPTPEPVTPRRARPSIFRGPEGAGEAAAVTPPARTAETASEPAQQATPAERRAPAADVKALEELQERMVMLASRAGAVRSSLETLQRQQAAMGLNLRGDILASWKRMEHYMDQAEAALNKRDAAATRRHLEAAEREIDRLENFLGR